MVVGAGDRLVLRNDELELVNLDDLVRRYNAERARADGGRREDAHD